MKKRVVLKRIAVAYVLVWLSVWFIGAKSVNSRYYELVKKVEYGTPTEVAFSDLNENWEPTIEFEGFYHSKGVTISPFPFVFIFPASFQTHSMAGFAGYLGALWLPFYDTFFFPLYAIWVS